MPVNVIIVRVNDEDDDDDDDVRSLLQCATRRGDKREGAGSPRVTGVNRSIAPRPRTRDARR